MKLSLFYTVFAATAFAGLATAVPVVNDSAEVVAAEARSDAAQVDIEPIFAARSGNVHGDILARHSKRKSKKPKAKATYYEGNQLDNPACGGKTPKSSEHIAAVGKSSPFNCGDHVTLSKGGKSVTVKVVDKCESCAPHHLDLSTSAFKKLAPLSEGVIEDIEWST